MMKKIIFLSMVLMLSGCAPTEEKEEGHSSMIVTSDGEVVSAYRDGEDVTDERLWWMRCRIRLLAVCREI